MDFTKLVNLLSLGDGQPGVVGLPQVFVIAAAILIALLVLFGLATLASRFFRQSIDTMFEILLFIVLLVAILWYFFGERSGYF